MWRISLNKPEAELSLTLSEKLCHEVVCEINQSLYPKVRLTLLSEQIGVGIRNASEVTIHALRGDTTNATNEYSKVIVKLDLMIAFIKVE